MRANAFVEFISNSIFRNSSWRLAEHILNPCLRSGLNCRQWSGDCNKSSLGMLGLKCLKRINIQFRGLLAVRASIGVEVARFQHGHNGSRRFVFEGRFKVINLPLGISLRANLRMEKSGSAGRKIDSFGDL